MKHPPKINAKQLKIVQTLFIIGMLVLVLVLLLQISFIGKNLTYASRFTPPSTEKNLRNQSFYVITQALVLLLSTLSLFALPFLGYVALTKSTKIYILYSGLIITLNILTFLICLYFLIGNSNYRSYLNNLDTQIVNNSQYCDKNLCQATTCIRIWSYIMARKMTIAYLVISQFVIVHLLPFGYIINRGKRSLENLQLLS